MRGNHNVEDVGRGENVLSDCVRKRSYECGCHENLFWPQGRHLSGVQDL
jgi:hypothetical protein